jgi:hypothetical protein
MLGPADIFLSDMVLLLLLRVAVALKAFRHSDSFATDDL